MTDPIPDNSHRLAYLLGIILHPFFVFIPTTLIAIGWENVHWVVVILVVFVAPIGLTIGLLYRHGRFAYQRDSRTPIYVVGIISLFIVIGLAFAFDAPLPLISAFFTVIVWSAIQLLVNRYITKASIHVSVATICLTGLVLLGHIDTLLEFILSGLIIIAVGWARMTTKNHTREQVIVGFLTGLASTLIVAPFFMR